MLDIFSIFTKGGIVLFCFNNISTASGSSLAQFSSIVNNFVKTVLLQERTDKQAFEQNGLRLQYKLDNEFELVFIVGYQNFLQLSYVDKFLDDIQLEFRDKFLHQLQNKTLMHSFDFFKEYQVVLKDVEERSREEGKQGRQMKSYKESEKAKQKAPLVMTAKEAKELQQKKKVEAEEERKRQEAARDQEILDEEIIIQNRKKLFAAKMSKDKPKSPKQVTDKGDKGKKGKEKRVWDVTYGGNTGKGEALDFSKADENGGEQLVKPTKFDSAMVGTMSGNLKGLEVEESSSEEEMDEEDLEEAVREHRVKQERLKKEKSGKSMFSIFSGLVGNKTLTREAMAPQLEKLKEHMMAKNVAADISEKLCESVATKLEGRVLGTFEGLSATIKSTLSEALVQILSPKRRIDILRDVFEARRANRPYVMTFCGVNGVGKSTNLAKICFWLIENNVRVLIAACDTFRAGAVEQLRTHTKHLNALHPPERHGGAQMVQLYEKGYGKDAAGIAMEAIHYAQVSSCDLYLALHF